MIGKAIEVDEATGTKVTATASAAGAADGVGLVNAGEGMAIGDLTELA